MASTTAAVLTDGCPAVVSSASLPNANAIMAYLWHDDTPSGCQSHTCRRQCTYLHPLLPNPSSAHAALVAVTWSSNMLDSFPTIGVVIAPVSSNDTDN